MLLRLVFLFGVLQSLTKCAPQHNKHFPDARNSSLIRSVPTLDGRILGGGVTHISYYPYQLSLEYGGNHICGAALIADSWALTAAHCTDGYYSSWLTIRAGSSTSGYGGQVIQVARVHQHPWYTSWNLDYDISVLELADSVTAYYSAAITMAPANNYVPSGVYGVVTGWGAAWEGGGVVSQLQTVVVPTVDQQYCQQMYGYDAITDNMICAGYTEFGGYGTCQGDSGGPLVVDGVLTGLVSWGYGCARPYYPTVYTRVSALREFIFGVTGI